MSDAKEEKKVENLLETFRLKLKEASLKPREIEKLILEGLKSARSEVRAFAAKKGINHYDREWVKKNVLNLLEHEKSKKVLRIIEKYYSGDKFKKALERLGIKKLKSYRKQSTKKQAGAAPAAAEEAPKS